MKYLFLLYADESGFPAPGSPELQAQLEAYGAFFEEVDGRGQFQAGDPVQPPRPVTAAQRDAVRDGRTSAEISDGPASPRRRADALAPGSPTPRGRGDARPRSSS